MEVLKSMLRTLISGARFIGGKWTLVEMEFELTILFFFTFFSYKGWDFRYGIF